MQAQGRRGARAAAYGMIDGSGDVDRTAPRTSTDGRRRLPPERQLRLLRRIAGEGGADADVNLSFPLEELVEPENLLSLL